MQAQTKQKTIIRVLLGRTYSMFAFNTDFRRRSIYHTEIMPIQYTEISSTLKMRTNNQ